MKIQQNTAQFCKNEVEKVNYLNHFSKHFLHLKIIFNIEFSGAMQEAAAVLEDEAYVKELKKEMASLMERNKSMGKELKEMQERYSDMSLRFAEVEGERQQLVMKLRNLKNSTNL